MSDFASWTQPSITDPRTVPIQPGFNLLGWTGVHNTAVGEALDGLDGLAAAFSFDSETQVARAYRSDGPAFLSDLDALPFGAGVWVLTDTPGDITVTPATLTAPDSATALAFDLEPSGTTFGSPLILTTTVNALPGT